MFSRYKKPQIQGARPIGASEEETPAPAPDVAPVEVAPKAPPPTPPTAPKMSDKDLKRRERIEELKTEMHHRLLDNLNLS
ncbi:MAG: CpaF family protein, partial [Pseudomonadota bacterium]